MSFGYAGGKSNSHILSWNKTQLVSFFVYTRKKYTQSHLYLYHYHFLLQKYHYHYYIAYVEQFFHTLEYDLQFQKHV